MNDLANRLLELTTTEALRRYSERSVKLGRIDISIEKLLISMTEGAEHPGDPQKVHFQVIENILFEDPDLLDAGVTKDIFKLKAELDAGVRKLPVKDSEAKEILMALRKGVRARKAKIESAARKRHRLMWIIVAVLLVAGAGVVLILKADC